jgi:hypothetical protein
MSEKPHIARKGVGCRHEYQDEPDMPVLCGYAEMTFGGYHECKAPGACYMDDEIKEPYDDEEDCPNCSQPNKPFKLLKTSETTAKCEKCGYEVSWR